jgi:hypothetical protein
MDGSTALTVATEICHMATMKLLLEAGANPEVKDKVRPCLKSAGQLTFKRRSIYAQIAFYLVFCLACYKYIF